jgi:putative ATPase
MDIFDYQANRTGTGRPLADRMRPRSFKDFVGQRHILGPGSMLREAIEADRVFSMILWGPPGCGKTTLAKIVASETRSHFVEFSAVLSGVKEIRAVIAEARDRRRLELKNTILFVDEIHRFNKAQQDAFLPHVESGLITLIGATTENPSFEVIPALMSRCRTIVLEPLSSDDMVAILTRALEDTENGLGKSGLTIEPEAMNHLIALSDGDVRAALNGLEIVAAAVESRRGDASCGTGRCIVLKDIENALQKRALLYDKSGEAHYNVISALHKSLRGSDPDAALYWLARMLAAGEDPLYIARRMVRFASEDVGNADPHALTVALNAMEAYRFIGSPEGDLALAQAAVYLATAPKSNSIYTAYGRARKAAETGGSLPVPLHIRNAPTRLMKDLGYGRDYQYAHDFAEGYVPQDYLPEALAGKIFYYPTERGYEKIVKQRLDRWRSLKKQKKPSAADGGETTA